MPRTRNETKNRNMKKNSLKRFLATLAAALVFALSAMGQQGLHIDNAFRLYGRAKGCKMVEMHDTELRGYKLATYKSLTFKKLTDEIDHCLEADRKSARKVREVVEDGRLVSGYYMMKPLEGGANRYILFSYGRDGSGAIIYIEGRLSPEDIMKLCYS